MKLNDLLNRIEKLQPARQSVEKDDRFWKPTKDKTDNAYAMIRFLPSKNSEDLPFVRIYSHGFKNEKNGKWFVENCPTTVGKECPVCDANSALWDTGEKANKELASSRKRNLSYVSNILVVQDEENPDSEGKVYLFKYGQKIFDKLMAAMKPAFKDDDPINPFDMEDGHNFKLKVTGSGRDTSYEASSFSAKSSSVDVPESKLFDINELVAEGQFKSYDDLKGRFEKVVNGKVPSKSNVAESPDDADDDAFMREQMAKASAKKNKRVDSEDNDSVSIKKEERTEVETKSSKTEEKKNTKVAEDDDDDDYFAKLAKNLDD